MGVSPTSVLLEALGISDGYKSIAGGLIRNHILAYSCTGCFASGGAWGLGPRGQERLTGVGINPTWRVKETE